MAVTNNATIGGTLNVTGATTLSSLTVTGTETDNGILTCSSALITQGLMYEAIGVASQTSVNIPSFSYGGGGLFYLGSTISAQSTLTVTNIPTDFSKTYTFNVAYYFPNTSARFYINSVTFTEVGGASILNGAPLWNGGTPVLTTGTTPCMIIQQFTILGNSTTFGGSRRVISSVSCCT